MSRIIRSFPSPLRKKLRLYLKGLERRSSAQRSLKEKYWTAIPRALVRSYHRGRTLRGPFLEDILWGQYCTFLSVRIHDDLFDNHVRDQTLGIAADMILDEGKRAFARHFGPQSSFWNTYRTHLAQTQEAIVDVDPLQRRRAPPRIILRQYPKVSAIFKIGLAAVCIRYNRRNEFRRVAACFDEIATAGHIVDDVEDVDEDLRRRRFNYVAAMLAQNARIETGNPDHRLHIAQAVLYGDATKRIMREAKLHLIRSEKALRGLRVPEVRRYLRKQRNAIDLLSRRLQRGWIHPL